MSDDPILDEVAERTKKEKRAAYMREYRKKNPEKQRALDKILEARKRAKNPEKFTQAANERSKKYYHRRKLTETPEQREKRLAAHRTRCQKWIDKDPEHVRRLASIAFAKRYAANPQKFIDQVHRRRALFVGDGVTKEEWDNIKKVYGYRCAYCREKVDELCQDHFIPVTKGGPHCADNIVPACRPCNTRKLNHIWPYPEPWTEPPESPVSQGV